MMNLTKITKLKLNKKSVLIIKKLAMWGHHKFLRIKSWASLEFSCYKSLTNL